MQVSSLESASYCSIIIQTTPVLLYQIGPSFIAWLGLRCPEILHCIANCIQKTWNMCSYRVISSNDFRPDIYLLFGKKMPQSCNTIVIVTLIAHVPRDNISDKLIWEWWKPCDVVGQHQHSAVAAMPACYFTTTFLQQLHCYRKDSLTSTTGDPAATRASFWNSALRLSSQVRVRSNINITASLLQC